MNDKIHEQLKALKLKHLQENLDSYLELAEKKVMSHSKFLDYIFEKEIASKLESSRLARIKRANIPLLYQIETFPFAKQPHLNKKRILQYYDTLDYLEKKRNVIFIGPTGSGKTGLATSFMVQALNNGYSGRFVTFFDLVQELYKSQADQSTERLVKKYASYDCLVIDEMGYIEFKDAQIGSFFSLMQKRYKRSCTMITTNLGFKDWHTFLKNPQLAAALIDRLIDNGHVIKMKDSKSLRTDAEID
jgi:DNA replication protein DnaC